MSVCVGLSIIGAAWGIFITGEKGPIYGGGERSFPSGQRQAICKCDLVWVCGRG